MVKDIKITAEELKCLNCSKTMGYLEYYSLKMNQRQLTHVRNWSFLLCSIKCSNKYQKKLGAGSVTRSQDGLISITDL